MKSLDILGIESGTDKSRLRNDYLRHYERVMSPFRDLPITLIEIGVHNGGSLAMWEKYFTHARIIGLDIEPAVQRFERGRVQIKIGSQFDGDFLQSVMTENPPDIVIDDGSHIDEHQIFTFEKIFPSLRLGGIYIVEDIVDSRELNSAATYFCSLQRDALRGECQAEVASVDTMRGAVIIRKRFTDNLDEEFDDLEDIVIKSGHPESLFHLAEYMRRNNSPLDRTLATVRRASVMNPDNGWVFLELSRVLVLLGRTHDALEAATKAQDLILRESGYVPAPFLQQIASLV